MYIELGLIAAMLGDTAMMPASPPLAEELTVERFGLYVLADDLDRAGAFYQTLFGRQPQIRTATLIGFDVAGGFYAVASRRAYAPGTPAASSVRPYVKVADLKAALRRVRALSPACIEGQGIVREGSFSFFRFRDSEGNVVEFFSVD